MENMFMETLQLAAKNLRHHQNAFDASDGKSADFGVICHNKAEAERLLDTLLEMSETVHKIYQMLKP